MYALSFYTAVNASWSTLMDLSPVPLSPVVALASDLRPFQLLALEFELAATATASSGQAHGPWAIGDEGASTT